MSRIVKVVFHDKTTLKLKVTPLEHSEDPATQIRNNRVFKRQFDQFDEDILGELDENVIENYALDNFDLVKEEEVEEKCLGDFSDDEIMDEAGARNLIGTANDIFSERFLKRFAEIIAVAKPLDIDCLLDELERKYNL